MLILVKIIVLKMSIISSYFIKVFTNTRKYIRVLSHKEAIV